MTTKQDQNNLSKFIIDAHKSLNNLKEFHQVQTDFNTSVTDGLSNIKELFIKFGNHIDALDKRLKRIELLLASEEFSGHA